MSVRRHIPQAIVLAITLVIGASLSTAGSAGPVAVGAPGAPGAPGAISADPPLAATAEAAPPPIPPELVVSDDQAAPVEATGADDPNLPAPAPERGVVWDGLSVGRADGPCAGGYEAKLHGRDICSHGPDPAPEGIDVRAPRTFDQLAASTTEGTTAAATTAGVPCSGDGTSGSRVQAIYARAADVTDRYASLAGMFPQWAANTNQVFVDSAAETGGTRNVRWVTDPSCNLAVARVQLSTTGDDTWNAMMGELWNLGFNRQDRKYLVWMDAGIYCGLSDIDWDDRAITTNYNNSGPSFARVDRGCWGLANPVEAHELMHGLGGVQQSAPHSTSSHHCSDDSDRMCSPGSGVVMTYPCPSTHERLFDCNHDDYFHTSPEPTSYLGTHWNTAMSAFLDGGGSGPTPTTTVPPPTTTTLPPTTTTSTTIPTATTTTTTVPPTTGTSETTFSGSLTAKKPTRTYSVITGAGPLTATLSFSGAASTLTLTAQRSDGTVLGSWSGASPMSVSVPVPAGTQRIVVNQSVSDRTSFTLQVTYATP